VIQNLHALSIFLGFARQGVPRQILLQRLGNLRLKATALEELIQNGIQEALKQSEIQAIAQPQLRSSFEDLVNQYEPGKPITFVTAVDVQPSKARSVQRLASPSGGAKYDPAGVEKSGRNRTEMATLIPVEGLPLS